MRELDGGGTTGHVTEAEFAGLMDADLDLPLRQRLESHLESCAECRAVLADLARLAVSLPSVQPASQASSRALAARRRWIPWLVGTALAAGIATILLVQSPTKRVEPVRAAAAAEGRAVVVGVFPAEGDTVRTSSPRFTWRDARVSTYHFVLLTEDGTEVWSDDTGDTTATPPSSVVLQKGKVYFWLVEGIADGITATSRSHRFLVAP